MKHRGTEDTERSEQSVLDSMKEFDIRFVSVGLLSVSLCTQCLCVSHIPNEKSLVEFYDHRMLEF